MLSREMAVARTRHIERDIDEGSWEARENKDEREEKRKAGERSLKEYWRVFVSGT